MTIETYNKATKILEEKKRLEEQMLQLQRRVQIDFVQNVKEYEAILNRLFVLGQEFAAL